MATATRETTREGGPQTIPFAAFLPGNKERESASNQLLQTWKQQLDTGLKLVDAGFPSRHTAIGSRLTGYSRRSEFNARSDSSFRCHLRA